MNHKLPPQSESITAIKVDSYRSLADLAVSITPITVCFGPNGAGKSTFLDALKFLRECAFDGIERAAVSRGQGIGLLRDSTITNNRIGIELLTHHYTYHVEFEFRSGMISPKATEQLSLNSDRTVVFDTSSKTPLAIKFGFDYSKTFNLPSREGDNLLISKFFRDNSLNCAAANTIAAILHGLRSYRSRDASLNKLRAIGSEISSRMIVDDDADNLWSVLRNLHDRRDLDARYNSIMESMKRAFSRFKGLFLEQTGNSSVYGHFVESGRKYPTQASRISDGYLQLLINLTELFCEGPEVHNCILFDEPDLSLHPWAIVVFANAVKLAVREWNKQVIIATHSPVLLSQFEPDEAMTVELNDSGLTVMKRVSDMKDLEDLLGQFAIGSLYMAEAVAPQRGTDMSEVTP